MPKNKGKGGKNRRRGKNENEGVKRDLIYKESGQEYARVERLLGNGRLEAFCFDNIKRLCHIRGKLRKKVWINAGDIILVGLRDYQDKKADVIMKYLNDEARTLKVLGEIPEGVQVDENNDIQFDENATVDLPEADRYVGGLGGGNDDSDSDDSDESDDDDDSDDSILAFGAGGNPNLPPAGAAMKKATALTSVAATDAEKLNKKNGKDSDDDSDSDESGSEEEGSGEEGDESYRYKDRFGPDKFRKDKRVNHPVGHRGRGGKGKRGK